MEDQDDSLPPHPDVLQKANESSDDHANEETNTLHHLEEEAKHQTSDDTNVDASGEELNKKSVEKIGEDPKEDMDKEEEIEVVAEASDEQVLTHIEADIPLQQTDVRENDGEPDKEKNADEIIATTQEEFEHLFEESMPSVTDVNTESTGKSETPEETDQIAEATTKEDSEPEIGEPLPKSEVPGEDLAHKDTEISPNEETEPISEEVEATEIFEKDLTHESAEGERSQEENTDTEKDNEVTIEIVKVEHEQVDRVSPHEETLNFEDPSQNDSTDENERSMDVPTLVKIFESSFTESNQQMTSPKKDLKDTEATTWVFESEGVNDENEQENLGDSTVNDNVSTEPDEMKLPMMETDLGKEDQDKGFSGSPEKLKPTEVADSNQLNNEKSETVVSKTAKHPNGQVQKMKKKSGKIINSAMATFLDLFL